MAGDFDFDGALDRLLSAPPDLREKLLAEYEKERPDASPRLKRLLSFALGDSIAPSSLDEAAPSLFSQFLLDTDLGRVGKSIGPYKITSLINRGGMGVVYKAQRNDDAYEQTVAVKFLPKVMNSAQRKELFQNERANLARLEHPHIARIIDAGVSDDNSPYFVMEYVSGEPIDSFCDGLQVKQILAIFQQLCDAVSYCHQSFVVHGDIKPSNVFVANKRVRLLDFGVGKFVGDERSQEGVEPVGFTATYAAPEVKNGGPHSIPSDIYSLGLLLDQLLDGSGDGYLSGDLKLIASQCLRESPQDRYKSVESLARDIQAYTRTEPISARSRDRGYVARKFIERNKIIVGSMFAVFISVVLGFATTLWQYSEATLEAKRVAEVSVFVRSLFERIDPEAAGEQDVTLRQILDEASVRIDKELTNAPEVRHDLMALIASGYAGLGDHEKSLSFRQMVLDYHLNTKSVPHVAIASARSDIAPSYAADGNYEMARRTMQDAMEEYQALGLDETLEYASLLGSYAILLMDRTGDEGNAETAFRLLEEKGTLLKKLAPDDAYLQYIHLANLASVYDDVGDLDQSVELKREAVSIAEQNGYELQMSAMTALCNLGYTYDGLGRFEEAIETHKKCIDRRTVRLGEDHVEMIAARQNMAAAHFELGKFETGRDILEKVVLAAEKQLPEKSLSRLAAELNLARVQIYSGDATVALQALPDILQRMEGSVGSDAAAYGRAKSILGKALLARGNPNEAVTHLRDAYAIIKGSSYWDVPGHQWVSDVALWRTEAEFSVGNKALAQELGEFAVAARLAEPNLRDWRKEEAKEVSVMVRQ